MIAQFDSTCPVCEQPIHEGDEIVNRWSALAPEWRHAQCPKPEPRGKVCPKCFLEMALSGEHDCEYDR